MAFNHALKRLGRLQRALLLELSEGDPLSMSELAAGRPYISVRAAIKALEREGLVETWKDDFNFPRKPRIMAQMTASTLATIRGVTSAPPRRPSRPSDP